MTRRAIGTPTCIAQTLFIDPFTCPPPQANLSTTSHDLIQTHGPIQSPCSSSCPPPCAQSPARTKLPTLSQPSLTHSHHMHARTPFFASEWRSLRRKKSVQRGRLRSPTKPDRPLGRCGRTGCRQCHYNNVQSLTEESSTPLGLLAISYPNGSVYNQFLMRLKGVRFTALPLAMSVTCSATI